MLKKLGADKNGQAIVIVMIVSAMLLIIGGAVLAFASNNSTNASHQYAQKKAYYIAKSAINAMDASLQATDKLASTGTNTLGYALISDAVSGYSGTALSRDKTINVDDGTAALTSNSGTLDDYSISGMKVRYKGSVTEDTTAANSVMISLTEVTITLTAKDIKADTKYTVTSNYKFSGTATVTGGALTGITKSEWTQGGTTQ
jgi:hypothetical protein